MTDSLQGNISVSGGRPANPNAPQRARRKSPLDFTGKQMQDLAEAKATELAQREKEIGLVNAVAAHRKATTEVDMTRAARVRVAQDELAEVELKTVEVRPKVMHGVRVNSPIQDMTFGRFVFQPGDPDHPLGADAAEPYVGPLQTMSFEEGVPYSMDTELYDYLDAKGYIWH